MASLAADESARLEKVELFKPMIAFCNSKSGGGRGKVVLESLGVTIGKERVFDLVSDSSPPDILGRKQFVDEALSAEGLRVLVCGGDGTMTWIMASVDAVRETQNLGEFEYKVLVSMMPLGTGNDLARTFGWGGTFRPACTKPGWVKAVENADKVNLDRWLISVVPTAEHLEEEVIVGTNIPDIFSVHEYNSKPFKPTHSIVSRGLHHADTLTKLSLANFQEQQDEVVGGSFSENGEGSEESFRASESIVVSAGRKWRSLDGTFSNYFSVGVDAAGAFAFHTARRANPKRFNSAVKNQLLYAWLGTLATGGMCCCEGPPPLLAKVSTLSVLRRRDGDHEPKWEDVKLPSYCRGIIVLNLQSYGGGRDMWGKPRCCEKTDAKESQPAVDDGILEVVVIKGIFNLAGKLCTTNGMGGRAERLLQAEELKFKVRNPEGVYMQIDGEPWHQSECAVHIKRIGQSTVLLKKK